jgi:hypothetical protein
LKKLSKPNLYLALIHYPVVNKNGETIASAVTNLDLHDIARASKTFGVKAFYVVTPLKDQKELVEKIISHWITGNGAVYNPARRSALELIRVAETFDDVKEDISREEKTVPKTVVTCAKPQPACLGYDRFREMLNNGTPYLLNFGTAWGLSREFLDSADYILAPVKGDTDYNHLSVRSAVSIILDRLLGI